MRRITEGHQNHIQSLARLLQTPCLGLFVALLIASWPQLIMAADPIIITVTSPPGLSTLIDEASIVSTSWSQSKPYTGVSIAILVDSAIVGQTPMAHAYLTTQIGPGTTTIDEIAHTRFTVPANLPVCSPASCGAMVTLFSGLTLGPGNYFVTLSPDPMSIGAVGWFPALPPTVLVDAGVSQRESFSASAVAPYPPANAFGVLQVAMNIVVTATPAFAGIPGKANCHGQTVSALARQFGGLDRAASALSFPSVQALQDAIRAYCKG